ncbi:hypothetical protein BV898_01264 [Hypsibius exemplaris]|uniref:PAW domain-containing protein n=1 Tax=Hypsibius exemplaris TaxID=2072580 RepID=A0A1W0XC68_HYPEX|nr:hypothetical protein BV898_01264 [Hypsibius exemplaris]
MPMASHRRIHNFGPQHRVPSIEVYSSSSPPKDSQGEYIYYGGGGGGLRTTGTTANSRTASRTPAVRSVTSNKKSLLLVDSSSSSAAAVTPPSRDFRILSSSLNPLINTHGHHPNNRRHSHGRITNSRSTGNLSIPNEHDQGPNELILIQKPVHHASSQGVLGTTPVAVSTSLRTSRGQLNAARRQDSSSQRSTPSPTRRLQFVYAKSPGRMMQRTNTAAGNSGARRERLRSPYASFDDYNGQYGEDEETEEDGRLTDSPKSGHGVMAGGSEPLTVLGNVIRPSTHETTARKLEVRYSARNDKYKRPTNPIRMKANGWNTLVYAERNMEWLTEHCRSGEQEEVMTYLSRKPGTSSAYIEWRFDFTEAGLRVKKCSLKFPFETFEDGHVRVYLKADNSDDALSVYSSLTATDVPKMRGWDKFSLIAELDCERDACAFQHAQLFRQQLKSGFFDKQEEKYQFLMSLELYSMY